MKVQHWDGTLKEMPIADAIAYEVEAANSGRGQLEDLEEKVRVLTAIVAALTEYVGAEAAREVLGKVGRYHKPHLMTALIDGCDDGEKNT